MITIDGVCKRFGRTEILRDVNLAIRAGAVTALTGPNGSGKTTLIKLMLGLARTDVGRIAIDGTAIDAPGEYRANVGYMPQIARFPEHLRVRDLLETVAALRPSERLDDQLIDEFHLAREFDKPLGTLSGGTRQKVNAAIAFRFRPRILILDEPTAGLDPVASRILKQKVRSARGHGSTVLITSHVLSEIEELADDIAFLHEGSLEFAGSVRDLLICTGQSRLEPAIAALMERGEGDPVFRATSSGAMLSLVTGGGSA